MTDPSDIPPLDERRQILLLFEQALRLERRERSGFLAQLRETQPALAVEVERRLQKYEASAARFALLKDHQPYIIETTIGRGATATVFRARHTASGQIVALKVMHSATGLNRFLLEAQIGAVLKHPNIVQVFDCRMLDGQPTLCMEYVEGHSLAEWLTQFRGDARRAAALVRSVAGALSSAHEQGIIHRDIKPSNILMTEQGVPKLSDFGVARRSNAVAAPAGEAGVFGTPPYMPPEQLTDQGVGPTSDIYALGAVLYELLTGTLPFAAADPKVPRSIDPTIPRDIEVICLKCLRKNPSERYLTAVELAADLDRFIRGDVIRADPYWVVSYAGRLVTAATSRSLLTAAVYLLVTAVIVVAVGWPWAFSAVEKVRTSFGSAIASWSSIADDLDGDPTESEKSHAQVRDRREWARSVLETMAQPPLTQHPAAGPTADPQTSQTGSAAETSVDTPASNEAHPPSPDSPQDSQSAGDHTRNTPPSLEELRRKLAEVAPREQQVPPPSGPNLPPLERLASAWSWLNENSQPPDLGHEELPQIVPTSPTDSAPPREQQIPPPTERQLTPLTLTSAWDWLKHNQRPVFLVLLIVAAIIRPLAWVIRGFYKAIRRFPSALRDLVRSGYISP